METEEDFKRVYTGSEVNVQYLQDLLQQRGIATWVRNEFDSGLRAGFGGGLPGQVQLFSEPARYEEALEIVKETFPNEPS